MVGRAEPGEISAHARFFWWLAMTQNLRLHYVGDYEGVPMNSRQITTGPTLKQFATLLNENELEVTSKLGTSTISRVRFRQLDYPTQHDLQISFLRSCVQRDYPVAETILGCMFERCINDQAKVLAELLSQ